MNLPEPRRSAAAANTAFLGEHTTLGLGGPAHRFLRVASHTESAESIAACDRQGEDFRVLGGGSNVVIADDGLSSTVIQVAIPGISITRNTGTIRIRSGAGEIWDDLVLRSVDLGFFDLTGLSGIPGWCGAAAIQNIGAYGQEISDTLESVSVYDRVQGRCRDLPADALDLGYRTSIFKRQIQPGAQHTSPYVILGITIALKQRDANYLKHSQIEALLSRRPGEPSPTPNSIRQAVLALRARKGMIIDPQDTESRSAGSFFLNPIVSEHEAHRVSAIFGVPSSGSGSMPAFEHEGGQRKLSAAWLIEKTGFPKGYGTESVSISRKHSLALVHRGGGTTRELIGLAQEIQAQVAQTTGIRLQPEPHFLGDRIPALWSTPGA